MPAIRIAVSVKKLSYIISAASLSLAAAACSSLDSEKEVAPQSSSSTSMLQCQSTTHEAEQMYHSTGGSTTGGWNIWSNGYISTNHGFTAGQTSITVIAKGSIAAGVWPHMRVSVGGNQIGSTYVNTTAWSSYPFVFTAITATQEIRVIFDNDYLSSSEDRNLLVDKIVVGCPTSGSGGTGGTPYPTGVAFRGINRAGMEYGEEWWGWAGHPYYEMPSHTEILGELAYFKARGMNVIRLPIAWERVQHQLYGALTQDYVDHMMDYINSATAAGFVVILDLHNYNRYATNAYDSQGNQIYSYTQHTLYDGILTLDHLRNVWVKLATLVLGNPKVILNLMNESHDFDRTSNEWFADINTLISAIRATGSRHLILVPNSRSSDVDYWFTWAPNGGDLDADAALAVTDPVNNYAYDMHAYQEAPDSCSSYRDLIVDVTNWATTNHKKLFLSELGVADNAYYGPCAISYLLSYMNSHNDVWIGWTPWDLDPYNITIDHTADNTEMPWYSPFLTANFLP